MRSLFFAFSSLLPLLAAAQDSTPQNFTISNGQIFTPGLAILNSPQPNTPMGGGSLPLFAIGVRPAARESEQAGLMAPCS